MPGMIKWLQINSSEQAGIMLLDQEQVEELLRCPKTGNKLIRKEGQLVSQGEEKLNSYRIVNQLPVLIDYDRSIINQQAVEESKPVVQRSGSSVKKRLKSLFFPPNKTIQKNIMTFIKQLKSRSTQKVRVLVVGGGSVGQGLEPLYADSEIELIAFDVYGSANIQFIADAHTIPMADACVDGVIIQAVLEHVLEPQKVVEEIYRVLKPAGIVFADTPFMQQVHEGAYDFTRFTESGHRYLFKKFSLIVSGVSSGAGTQLLWSLSYFFRSLFQSSLVGKAVRLCFFWLPLWDRLIPSKFNIDAACGVYFMGEKSDKSLKAGEIVDYYNGAQ